MSLKKSKKIRIMTHILELILRKKSNIVKETMDTFNISATTVYRYLSELQQCEKIKKDADGSYLLVRKDYTFKYDNNVHLEEDIIYQSDISPLLTEIPDNVKNIWAYTFTEMMNNAIEHSRANNIWCIVRQTALQSEIIIFDNGVGIFKKIQEYMENKLMKKVSIDDTIIELLAGKFTTDKQNHSGEGIFFSSRAVDKFCIYSSGKLFAHDNYDNKFIKSIAKEIFQNSLFEEDGTIVILTLSNSSPRKIKEVFDMFSDADKGFFKTQIPIQYAITNGYPVSRSQARRLCARFNEFNEVELDFKGVDDIGQAFAHELFIVFKRNHQNIKLHVVNANESVENMIKRVEATAMSSLNTEKADL